MKKKKRFDMFQQAQKPAWYLVALERLLTFFWLGFEKVFKGFKLDKSETKHLKGPVLCLSNHASMIDMPIAIAALTPLKTTWVAAIEEFDGKEWLFRNGHHSQAQIHARNGYGKTHDPRRNEKQGYHHHVSGSAFYRRRNRRTAGRRFG